ncbi:hypothetical protein BDR07DRAFT_1373563, partial [Suillus spraguei]
SSCGMLTWYEAASLPSIPWPSSQRFLKPWRVFLGTYDIGCGFTLTIENSSLGEKFWKMESCIASNQLAPVTCYSSSHCHHALFELFFKQWDKEKYLNLGTMILNNYKQALGIINSDGLILQQAMNSLRIHPRELETWRAEEVKYFRTLGLEPEWDVHAMAYVELLQEMQEYNAPSDYVFVALLQGQQQTYTAELSQTRKLETHHQYTAEKLVIVQHEVIAMEVKLGITCRWTPSTHEYQETMKYMATRKYHCALDNLQCLVVQCLFELQKLNISQTDLLQSYPECHKKYNEAASEIDPLNHHSNGPSVALQFPRQVQSSSRNTQDICEKPWAKPAIHETMCQYLTSSM